MSSPLVSLILVTFNSADLLPGFFAALATTRSPNYELIAVDNASADTTRDLLAGHASHVIANRENRGFGRACNQGASAATGEVLIFLNPDVRPSHGWLDGLLASSAACPDALICPTTLRPGETARPTPGLQQVAAIPGAAMLVRREVWQQLGGFDEHMFLYWEDVELCWRAWLLGYRVLADLGTVIGHQRGGSTGGMRWDAERARNSLHTYLKLMPWRTIAWFVPLLAAKTLVKYARWRDPALLDAWRWNGRSLGLTLAERRSVLRRRRGSYTLLGQRIRELDRRLRQERRARRTGAA